MGGVSLEVLQARYGDCLLLHVPGPEETLRVLVDGGPPNTWKAVLRGRLAALGGADPVVLDAVVVTHVDEDHIAGVLDLAYAVEEAEEAGGEHPVQVVALWHNAFEALRDAARPAARPAAWRPTGAVRAATVEQGIDLLRIARRFEWDGSGPFLRGQSHRLGDRLTLTVLGPGEEELAALREEWKTQEEALAEEGVGPAALEVAAAARIDASVYNLSSIVLLAEVDGRRLLLTGDARADHILEGLRGAGLLDGGSVHVDVFKLPHHGSQANASLKLFQAVTADHYVVSANGKHRHPSRQTLEWLLATVGDRKPTVHLTNAVKSAVGLLREAEADGRIRLNILGKGEPSLTIDLPPAP